MDDPKTNMSLRIDVALKDAIEGEATRTERTLSRLGEALLKWAWERYHAAGSLDRLRDESTLRFYSRRISRETQEQLYAALETAFDRAPSAAIDRIAETITRMAGMEWQEKAAAQAPDFERQAQIGREAVGMHGRRPRHKKGLAKT